MPKGTKTLGNSKALALCIKRGCVHFDTPSLLQYDKLILKYVDSKVVKSKSIYGNAITFLLDMYIFYQNSIDLETCILCIKIE